MMQIGLDVGGTKIEAAALDASGAIVARQRVPNPGGYDSAIDAIVTLVAEIERAVAQTGTVGVGVPGAPDPRTGLMRNANAEFLNGRRFGHDLGMALGRPVRIANDANCMVLSEAIDGAAEGAHVVFGVIVGTGVGGGLTIGGALIEGANGLGGEWGHVPLPWLPADVAPLQCWCGRAGCLETMISGTGFQRDYARRSGGHLSGAEIVTAADAGDRHAADALEAYAQRLGRALAMVANIVDPDVFVLGGGMSNVAALYPRLPAIVADHAFGGAWQGRIVPARWGDSSGVRGAARLWPAGSVPAGLALA